MFLMPCFSKSFMVCRERRRSQSPSSLSLNNVIARSSSTAVEFAPSRTFSFSEAAQALVEKGNGSIVEAFFLLFICAILAKV